MAKKLCKNYKINLFWQKSGDQVVKDKILGWGVGEGGGDLPVQRNSCVIYVPTDLQTITDI